LRRNCLSKHIIEENREGRVEIMVRRGRGRQLPDNFKEKRWYWKLKEEAFYGELVLEKALELSVKDEL
jgi:hypothetical protein